MNVPPERRRLSSLVSGAVTGGALAMQIGLAIIVGFVVGRELGQSSETDGFFAAYAVFMVLSLAASSARVVVLPSFAGGRAVGRLAHELMTSLTAVALLLVPLTLVVLLARRPVAVLLTGDGPVTAVDTAAACLVWLVVAGLGQVLAGVLASALAAFDEYVVPAFGYLLGSLAGLVLIIATIDEQRTLAIGHGLALNAFVAAAVPCVWLVREIVRSPHQVPWRAARPVRSQVGTRLTSLLTGSALPFGIQALYLVCLPFAGRLSVGSLTNLGYAFLLGGAVVSVGASAIGLVTAVPLTRGDLTPERIAHHIASSAWLGLVLVALAAGLTFSVGNELAGRFLGAEYGDLGDLTLAMTPYMVISVVSSVTFPVVLVLGRERSLPLIVALVLALQVGVAAAGAAVAGLVGLAVALAVSNGLMVAAMLRVCGVLGPVTRDVARAVVFLAGVATLAFVLPTLLAGPWIGAGVGLALFVVVLLVGRPRPLVEALHHIRSLS